MSDAPAPSSTGGCLLHVFRGLLGPGLFLTFSGLLLLERPPGIGFMDIVFLAVAAALVASAFLDPYSLGGSSHELKVPRRWERIRYAVVAGVLAAVIFVLRLAFRHEGRSL